MLKENNRILPLDGIRGLAVLFVVSFHYVNNQMMLSLPALGKLTLVEKALIKTTYFGWVGVDLFFVLSGFLIGSILIKNRQSPVLFKAFYIRRFARILPIYYLLLFLFLFTGKIVNTPGLFMFRDHIDLTYYFLFIQNFAMGHYNNFGPPSLTPTWSLAVEEQFYLIIPFIVFFLKPQQLKYFIACCLCIAPIGRYLATNWYQQYALLSSRIDSPAVGLLLAYILQIERAKVFIIKHLSKIKIMAIVLIMLSIVAYVFWDVGVFNHTIIALLFGVTILIAINTKSGILYKFVTLKPLLFIGSISYFIYLFHLYVLNIFHYLFLQHSTPQLLVTSDIIVTLMALIATILLGHISFKYIERPLISWSHRFKY